MKKDNSPSPDMLRKIIYQKYKVVGFELFFELPKDKRNEILTEVFEVATTYRMTPKGLVENHGAGPDHITGYGWDHLHSFEDLALDVQLTLKASRDQRGRARRAAFLVKKERFEDRKRKALEKLDKSIRLLMFEPQDRRTLNRLAQLQKLKKDQQDKDVNR